MRFTVTVMKLALGLVPGLAGAARGQVLWDGSAPGSMAGQGWSYAAAFGLAVETRTATGVRLDTTANRIESAGYARVLAPALDAATGFNLVVRFRLAAESHVRAERAGFSIILLDAVRRGIELGFWTSEVFAQADNPLFTRGESAARPFDGEPVTAVLSIRGDRYVLFVDDARVLEGPTRDYTAFTGFPDVYETPNFLFLGDDTTSAAGNVELFHVALVRPPVVQAERGGVLTWEGVPGQTYTVETSAELQTWTPAARVTSATADFQHTLPAGQGTGFWRVMHP